MVILADVKILAASMLPIDYKVKYTAEFLTARKET
jgi:hypothetical protein